MLGVLTSTIVAASIIADVLGYALDLMLEAEVFATEP
jgi:hypothetical protein